MSRYFVYIACRALSAGLGYALSITGILLASDFGRLIAFLDSVKPVSGLFDLLATRATLRGIAFEFFTAKAAVLLCVACAIATISRNVSLTVVIVIYLALWWGLTSFSTLYMRRETINQYGRYVARSGSFSRLAVRRIVRNRSLLTFMATSTVAAASYASLYLFHWSKAQFLSLRTIDATLLLVSFMAQLLIRGETPSRKAWLATLAAIFVPAACTLYFAGLWMSTFHLCRVGSLFLCARAMRHRRDKVISGNQAFLAVAYFSFSAFAQNASELPALLIAEAVSLFWLYRCGGYSNRQS